MKLGRWIPAMLLAVFAAACDSSTVPELDSDGQITGEVQETTEPSSEDSSDEPSGSPSRSSDSSTSAHTVVAASVRADGSLETLSEADVEGDGRYTLSVPSGRSDLVVSARSSSGAEVGRVIVRERTSNGIEVRAAPITASTTTEGRVYSRLRAEGMSAGAINQGELALFVRLNSSTATEAAASAGTIDTLAAGYTAAQSAMTEVLARTSGEASASARAELLADAAIQHDLDRHAGISTDAAGEAFVDAALDAYVAGDISAEALALATATATTSFDQALVQGHSATRLDVAKKGTLVGIRARERLLAELPASFAAFGTLAAGNLTDLRLNVTASADFSDFVSAVQEEEAAAEAAVTDAVMALVSSFSAETRAEVEARLEAAFLQADLSAHLDASASAEQKAQAVEEYRQELRAAVDALVDSLPQGVSLDAEATAKLLMAIRGGPSFS